MESPRSSVCSQGREENELLAKEQLSSHFLQAPNGHAFSVAVKKVRHNSCTSARAHEKSEWQAAVHDLGSTTTTAQART